MYKYGRKENEGAGGHFDWTLDKAPVCGPPHPTDLAGSGYATTTQVGQWPAAESAGNVVVAEAITDATAKAEDAQKWSVVESN